MNLKKIGKVFTSKFVGTGPSSYKKKIYQAAASQRLRNTGPVLLIALPFPLTFSCPSNRGEQKVAGFMRKDSNINFKVRMWT